jgi:hypothetical protein
MIALLLQSAPLQSAALQPAALASPAWFDLDPVAPNDLLGAFLICLLTLAIFSFLYRDNPFYKLAEHLFIGVGTAWYTLENYDSGVRKALFVYGSDTLRVRREQPGATVDIGGYPVSPEWALGLRMGAVALSIMLLLRLFRGTAWISRWPLALIIGCYAALKMTGETQARLVEQVRETMVSLWPAGTTLQNLFQEGRWLDVAGRLVLVLGLVCVLVHFLFTLRRTRTLGAFSRVGVIVLMLAFGARFGFAVLGRFALLIGRISELNSYASPDYALGGGNGLGLLLSPPWLMGLLMLLLLALGALLRRRNGAPAEPAS